MGGMLASSWCCCLEARPLTSCWFKCSTLISHTRAVAAASTPAALLLLLLPVEPFLLPLGCSCLALLLHSHAHQAHSCFEALLESPLASGCCHLGRLYGGTHGQLGCRLCAVARVCVSVHTLGTWLPLILNIHLSVLMHGDTNKQNSK